jgi:hypothetical protein
VAEFNALNASEEAAGRQGAVNTGAKTEREGEAKVKDEKPLLSEVSLDEKRKRDQQKKKRKQDDTDKSEDQDPTEAAANKLGLNDARRHLFEEVPADQMGDLTLTDPREMRRLLGASARFAQHAMLLGEQKRAEGATREQALEFMAGLYRSCGDNAYANKALREFGPATGIVDLYPLELVDHILATTPSFLVKTSRGSFFVKTTPVITGVAGAVIPLEYPADLRIKGFAMKGGGRVGYTFEPKDPPGTYHLKFDTPGVFEILVSASTKERALMVETLRAEIAPAKT